MAPEREPGAKLDGFWAQESTKIRSWRPSWAVLRPSWAVLGRLGGLLSRLEEAWKRGGKKRVQERWARVGSRRPLGGILGRLKKKVRRNARFDDGLGGCAEGSLLPGEGRLVRLKACRVRLDTPCANLAKARGRRKVHGNGRYKDATTAGLPARLTARLTIRLMARLTARLTVPA